jgi:hypothetical protein
MHAAFQKRNRISTSLAVWQRQAEEIKEAERARQEAIADAEWSTKFV